MDSHRTLGFNVARQTMVSLSLTTAGLADSTGNLYEARRSQTDYPIDTLETAGESGFILAPPGDDWSAQWLELSVVLHQLNRVMGARNAYPFSLSDTVVAELEFIRQRAADWRRKSPAAAADQKPGADSPPRPGV